MTDDEIAELYNKISPGQEWAILGLETAAPFARLIEARTIDQGAEVCDVLANVDNEGV